MSRLIGTIEDEDEVEVLEEDEDEEDEEVSLTAQGKRRKVLNAISFALSSDEEDEAHPWDFTFARSTTAEQNYEQQTSIDDKIKARLQQKKQKQNKKKQNDEEDDSDDDAEPQQNGKHDSFASDDEEDENEEDGNDEEGEEEEDGEESEEQEEEEEEEQNEEEDEEAEEDDEEEPIDKRRKQSTKQQQSFFTMPEAREKYAESFTDLHLSRPILKAISSLGYVHPTPIQSQAIPTAVQGKDICASATTGSGKTAAFVLPVLERLLHRDKRISATRVLILTPTRELAVQCHSVIEKLAKFSSITTCLVVGGLSNKMQEAALRRNPDIVVATPGRMIDHLRNAPSFSLDTIEILILDEADRLLDLGFSAELNEIVKFCPRQRQTMLFSATMTEEVDRLAAVSLNNPVRISVDPKWQVAAGITQEFIRIRSSKDQRQQQLQREAMLLSLCTRSFKKRVLIFFRSKQMAHRMKIVFGLLGLSAAELHGNLTQNQRLEALESFRDGQFDFLMATDLAARGLDILGIETIINFAMPNSLENYIHRVGRTARWGHVGRSISFLGEADRPLVKQLLKQQKRSAGGKAGLKNRVVPADAVEEWKQKIEDLEDDVQEILEEERQERQLRLAQQEAQRLENIIEHEEEIHRRPKRTWFQNKDEKINAKKTSLDAAVLGGTTRIDDDADVKKAEKLRKKQDAKNQRRAEKKAAIKRDKLAGLSRKQKRRKLAEMALERRDPELAKEQKSQSASAKALKKNYKAKKVTLEEEDQRQKKKRKRDDRAAARREENGGGVFASEMKAPVAKKAKTKSSASGGGGSKKAANGGSFASEGPSGNKARFKKKGKHQFKSKSKFKRRK
ncbi:Nucleolar DEAD-box protein required for synthesis of 60S ribosomal subunit [Balamuthia mandrillaris]